ncbi:MFS transporter [Lacticaseibacillus sp. GG6-2]
MNDRIQPRVLGAILATGLMSFCGVIVETAMNITFPTLMTEFHVTTNTVQWMTTLYLLVVASLVPLSATLKRRFKTRNLFLVAICLFIAGVVLDGAASQFWMLLLGRAVQGLGTGIALPLMFNIILEQVPRSKIGMMMGLGTLITSVAPAIGPTFGGLVVSTMSWRYIFVFLLPVLVLALILGLVCIRQKSATEAAAVDGLSVILIIVAFSGLIYGISQLNLVSGLVGVIALAGFSWRSLRIGKPIINLRLLGTKGFYQYVIAFTALQIAALGLSFVLPNYIQLVNQQSALQAGLIVLPGAAIGAIMAPLSGRLYDHVGARMPLRTGALLLLIGLVGMALFGHHLTDGFIIGLYLLCMMGMGFAYGNLMTDGLHQLAGKYQADGNAIFNTMQQFAAAVGTSIAATIIAAAQAAIKPLAVATATGSTTTFIVLAVLLVIAGGFIVNFTKA